MAADIFSARSPWMKLLLALAAALLYGLLNWAFNGVALPGAAVVSLRPQVAVPVTVGLICGPLAGFITGFTGNVFGDLLCGYGFQYWNWSVGNGLLGAVPGIAYLAGIRVIRTAGQFGLMLLLIVAANIVGLATGSFVDSLILHKLEFNEAVLEWLLPSLLTNVLLAFAIVPLCLLALKRLVLTIETRILITVTFLLAACILGTTAIILWRADAVLVSTIGDAAGIQIKGDASLDLLRWAGLAAVFVLLLGTVISVYMVKRLTSPVSILCTGAEVISSGRYETEVVNPVAKRNDELGELARTFKNMVESLKIQMKELETTTAANERIESELRVARDIQSSMLPRTFPPFPDRKELDIFASMMPAREVGGDFYDFFFTEDNKLCFLMGDVCGKGIPAALFMAISITLLRTEALRGSPPEKILARANQVLSQDNEMSMFFTGCCGILDTSSGEVLFANGGHNPPLLFTAGREADFMKMPGGLVVGAMPDVNYECSTFIMEPQETIFLYTDGATDAVNHREQMFSEDRLRQCVSKWGGRHPENIIGSIKTEIEDFTEGMPQFDDITMMAIRYNGNCG